MSTPNPGGSGQEDGSRINEADPERNCHSTLSFLFILALGGLFNNSHINGGEKSFLQLLPVAS